MNILVTGGAGYIGSITANQLNSLGHNVIVLDDLSEGKKEAVQDIKLYCGSYSDEQYVFDILTDNNIDTVMHFGASANVKESTEKPELYYDNNVTGTLQLLNACRKYRSKISNFKFILSSTAAVYGIADNMPIYEDTPHCSPCNPYGWSKLIIEQVLEDYYNAYGEEYLIFRYFCAAGATDLNGESRKSKETHLIPLTVESVINTDKVMYIYGDDFNTSDGTGIRDYVHVCDIAKAHISGMIHWDIVKNNVYNLGTDNGYSVKEVIEKANKLFNTTIKTEVTDQRAGDPATLIANNEKFFQYFGWKMSMTLEDMLTSAYLWRMNKRY
ncbi:UDP-glucose 4-epimerase GalE [archaeon]|nr:UDP-glucose 4-epimerase GalE [archaeon]